MSTARPSAVPPTTRRVHSATRVAGASAVAGVVKPGTSKKKLEKLLDGFDSFEGIMRDGTRQRRERDEHRLAELREEMSALEKSMTAETQRRQEMATSLQAWAAREIAAVEDRVRSALDERAKELQAEIAKVDARLVDLKGEFARDKAEVLAEVERRNVELAEKLSAFHELFEEEKKVRRKRESELEAAVSSAEQASEEAFSAERTLRERLVAEIKVQLEESVDSQVRADERLRAITEEEFAAIRIALDDEVKVREEEDDEILAALTRYAQKLQSSLSIINTTDVEFAPDTAEEEDEEGEEDGEGGEVRRGERRKTVRVKG